MNISIVVPQVFYDVIARILPGFVFLLALSLAFPAVSACLCPPESDGGNVIDSLGRGIGYAVLSYFLGWLFLAFTWFSKERVVLK